MAVSYEQMVEQERASKALESLKKIESKTELHTKRIDSKTIVSCKRKENIELYEEKIKSL